MTYPEIFRKAQSRCASLLDGQASKVVISSWADDPSAPAVARSFQEVVGRQGLNAAIVAAGPSGYDGLEPVVLIEKPDRPAVFYHHMTAEKAAILADAYLAGENPRPDMALCAMAEKGLGSIPAASQLALFRLQTRIALRSCGLVDPEEIDVSLVQAHGYEGLHKALQKAPLGVIDEVRASGLRGRGGAGFPVADKWEACGEAKGKEKYVVCNCLDSDPAARTGRLILEGDPHCMLEGMLIAAYAVGGTRCIICVGSGHSSAIRRVRRALDQMRSYGLLGRGILGSPFSVDAEVAEIEQSLVSGEETALLEALAGRQAMPYLRPPYPAQGGLKGSPTVVSSAETLADVSAILQRGAAWFSSIGTGKSKGSKVVTLSGDITRAYTVEVPFGTSLRALVEEIGGGVRSGRGVKAVQVGGPTGTFVGPEALDRTIDYETAESMGAIVGSGTIKVFANDGCGVEIAEETVSYIQAQSCGKCVFCREGTYQMADILKGISEKAGSPGDLELLDELAGQMRLGSICSLGKGAAHAVASSMRVFREDYEAHLKGKGCPSRKEPAAGPGE